MLTSVCGGEQKISTERTQTWSTSMSLGFADVLSLGVSATMEESISKCLSLGINQNITCRCGDAVIPQNANHRRKESIRIINKRVSVDKHKNLTLSRLCSPVSTHGDILPGSNSGLDDVVCVASRDAERIILTSTITDNNFKSVVGPDIRSELLERSSEEFLFFKSWDNNTDGRVPCQRDDFLYWEHLSSAPATEVLGNARCERTTDT